MNSLDRVGEWMRLMSGCVYPTWEAPGEVSGGLHEWGKDGFCCVCGVKRLMTKVYGPRDLREAYTMPREDAVWIMEHCADAWEAERAQIGMLMDANCSMAEALNLLQADNAALRERVEEAERQNAILRCHLADIDKTLDAALASLEYPGVPGVNDPGPTAQPNTSDDRKIRTCVELMDTLWTRDANGNRLRVEWGEPDAEGFYVPTIHVDYTDNPQRDQIAALRWRVEEDNYAHAVEVAAKDVLIAALREAVVPNSDDIRTSHDPGVPGAYGKEE